MKTYLSAAMILCATLCGGGWTGKPASSPVCADASVLPAPSAAVPIPKPSVTTQAPSVMTHATILYVSPSSGAVCKILNVWPDGKDVRKLDSMEVQALPPPHDQPLVPSYNQSHPH